MPLKYAPVCKTCRKHKTRHISGICSLCRRATEGAFSTCVVCGKHNTADATGVCSLCRKRYGVNIDTVDHSADAIDKKIAQHELALVVLRRYKNGEVISEIAKSLGVEAGEIAALLCLQLFSI